MRCHTKTTIQSGISMFAEMFTLRWVFHKALNLG